VACLRPLVTLPRAVVGDQLLLWRAPGGRDVLQGDPDPGPDRTRPPHSLGPDVGRLQEAGPPRAAGPPGGPRGPRPAPGLCAGDPDERHRRDASAVATLRGAFRCLLRWP